ncbi:HXXEE domain-containing protein [Oceanobacillus zhaokaii]|uniref:HXXEE domain-containing protein n=1 Tax=Oceanobacillus zhaokaii TaxID=2052660 RepID=A0A345PGX6_9BACI|nr:HXXEE domain-containing protein [Oceanobacillus zhaokaii]AXI09256.1 HXXEE domain-containing protein [Oceanobacillus zhaokaii]
MEQWLNVQTLIWLFPIVFVLHDLEEIIMVERWMDKNSDVIHEKLSKKIANKVIKQFSMSTAQFSVAVLVIFVFVSSSTYMASQYITHGPLGNIYLFTIMIMVFFLHVFTHIGQSILLQSITPGVITSIVIVFPYSIILFNSLFESQVITWNTIYVSLPFIVLIFPVLFFAHWIGKKVI